MCRPGLDSSLIDLCSCIISFLFRNAFGIILQKRRYKSTLVDGRNCTNTTKTETSCASIRYNVYGLWQGSRMLIQSTESLVTRLQLPGKSGVLRYPCIQKARWSHLVIGLTVTWRVAKSRLACPPPFAQDLLTPGTGNYLLSQYLCCCGSGYRNPWDVLVS